MRLIDAERIPKDEFFESLSDIEKLKVIQWMISAPTVDAVDVVRCKDCRKRYIGECPMTYIQPPNSFCKYGERKAEE